MAHLPARRFRDHPGAALGVISGYGRYMSLVEQPAQEAGAASGRACIARDVDMALS
jgi:hypothetical protein